MEVSNDRPNHRVTSGPEEGYKKNENKDIYIPSSSRDGKTHPTSAP